MSILVKILKISILLKIVEKLKFRQICQKISILDKIVENSRFW